MPTPIDKQLYEKVKKDADKIYLKPSAYKSGYIVKKYKELGGRYKNDDKPKNLEKWFQAKWTDINPNKTKNSYPVYRPTELIAGQPLPVQYLDYDNLIKQSQLKQKYKGKKNLPPFIYAV